MTTTPCPSDLALEQYLLGERPGAAEHIAGCASCQGALAAKRAAGESYLASPDADRLRQRLRETAYPRPRRATTTMALLAAALVACAIVWLLVRAGVGVRSSDRLAEKEVLEVEQEWVAAYLHDDTAALDRVLADDYTITTSQGDVYTKADDLESMKARATHFATYENFDVKVRVYGGTAIVTGRSKLSGTTSKGETFQREISFTDVLTRIDGRWRAVAAHISKIGTG